MRKRSYSSEEHALQTAYFEEHFPDQAGHLGRPFQLRPEHRFQGLIPIIRDEAQRIFGRDCLGIQWHTYIGHGRSSQACCLNFLMPLASRPALLKEWAEAVLGENITEVLPVESGVAAPHTYVAFEYTGPAGTDYLDEGDGKALQRGAHATASDAAFAYRDANASTTLVLIEWKYTEEYRNHRLSEDKQGKRHARYAAKMFAPNGPIRSDLGLEFEDFLHEPFYQLVRQQMLAHRIEADPDNDFDKAVVLHLSPSGNSALHHMTSPGLGKAFELATESQTSDAFEAYQECIVSPDRFVSKSIEAAFNTLAQSDAAAEWYPELKKRYQGLCVSRDA